MLNRKIATAIAATFALIAGTAAAADHSSIPSQAIEVGGHWTGKVGRDSTPGRDLTAFPSAAIEFSSIGTDNRMTNVAMNRVTSGYVVAFPSAAREFSSL